MWKMTEIKDIGKMFEKKTTAFLALGAILLIFSMYFNTTKENSSNIGVWISTIIIGIALCAQIVNWIIYWYKKY